MVEAGTFGRLFRGLAVLAALCGVLATEAATAQDRFITLGSTTSTDNSGLFKHMLPRFTATSGIAVRVIAVGTGAALRLGRQGDVDVLLVHARTAELQFVAAGHGVDRRDVMYNDFVLIGPIYDPAGIRGGIDIVADHNRATESFTKMFFYGNVFPTEIGCLDNFTGFWIDRPRATDSDPGNLIGTNFGIMECLINHGHHTLRPWT